MIVCTRERPENLSRCLDSLLRQQLSVEYEIIVVDNCPATGQTEAVVARHEGKVRYVLEPNRGLNFARNRGIAESRGRFVVFADDDLVTEPTWLDNLLKPFQEPGVSCVTGMNWPLELETEAQRLFETYQSLGRGEQPRVFDDSCSGPFFPLGSGVVGAGCNMAFRKDALIGIGMFEESLDVGTPSRGGGDLYAFYRMIRTGHKIAYQPGAVAYHKHRRTMRQLGRTMFDYGLGHSAYQIRCLISDKDPAALIFPLIWLVTYHLKGVARSLLGRSRLPFRFAALELLGYLLGPLGYLVSVVVVSRRRRSGGGK